MKKPIDFSELIDKPALDKAMKEMSAAAQQWAEIMQAIVKECSHITPPKSNG